MTPAPDAPPDDVAALQAALAAERLARREAEARASGAEAMVAHLKLLIAKLKHDRFGASSERGRKLLDQLELELDELVTAASEDAAKAGSETGKEGSGDRAGLPPRRQPVRAPAGPSAARAGVDPGADRLPLLRGQAVQARRGCHRDPRLRVLMPLPMRWAGGQRRLSSCASRTRATLCLARNWRSSR